MSKARLDESTARYASAEDVVNLAIRYKTPSIAFTYNDPTIFGEYVIDISRLAREKDIKTVMVTNGYIDREAREEVYEFIDAANVDLKAFTDRFYHKLTGAHLEDVLNTLVWLHHDTDVWLEITTLLIPEENDSPDEIRDMCRWIKRELGVSVPLHFTAFHPDFKMMDRPATPASTLKMARDIALEEGIEYCYLGNVHDSAGHTTRCPSCGLVLIERDWHSVSAVRVREGRCPDCGYEIAGRW
jgi:pyruvate formate lyase activating enzyme